MQGTYVAAKTDGTSLQFLTTEAFARYEEHEIQEVIIIEVYYQCSTGSRTGIYRQFLKLANNHAPRFLQETYEALVPLPLPKHFDVSPFIADGAGIMARDIDLKNNTVTFSLPANDYVLIESYAVKDDPKQFKAVLRFKEQVLKLPNKLELTVTATDAGVPQKSSQVSVVIEPDLSIVYDDPPEFKETFINRTIENGLLLRLELIPGTETSDVLYSVEGTDAEFFTQTVWDNNTGIDLKVVDLQAVPKSKAFLNVVVVARRTQLQKTSCVILLDIPPESIPEPPTATVQKVLSVLHLAEMATHQDIFPLVIDRCMYSIQSQTPGEYFFIPDATTSLASHEFDREDGELFAGLDFPQFWIVLKLTCPTASTIETQSNNNATVRLGPMNDIAFATDLTHLHIIVDDINDNSPVFTFPANNARYAFPSPQLSRKLLPDQLLTVQATDLDEGINAVIRYSLATNDHFDIDPHTGVIFPLKSAFASEESVTIKIFATDRDGAEDGNTSTMKLRVHKVGDDQLVALTVRDTDPDAFERTLKEISVKEGIQMETIRSVFSVDGDTKNRNSRSTASRYTTSAIVYAFKEDQLLNHDDLKGVFEASEANITAEVSRINELYGGPTTIVNADTTVIYPYIIIAAFFGTLAVAMAAAAFYYRSKTRQQAGLVDDSPFSRSSDGSDAVIVENGQNISSSTPPMETHKISEVMLTGSVDNPRSLSELLAAAKDKEHGDDNAEPTPPTQQERKKSIKFNESVERIEVFDV
ncbi:cadherin-89D-like isoform X1 [Anopheles stephensi]|nr:cadherin-89D-like isoform X1 [Anopheles stephensi]